MSTGVNFNPQYGMLDLRYAPPEELVMPKGEPNVWIRLESVEVWVGVNLNIHCAVAWTFDTSKRRALCVQL